MSRYFLLRGSLVFALIVVLNVLIVPTDKSLADALPPIIGTIPFADGIFSTGVNSLTNTVYVKSWRGDVSIVDGATNTIKGVLDFTNNSGVGHISVNSVTNRVYVVSRFDNSRIFDGASNSYIGTMGDLGFWSVAVNSVTNRVYISDQKSIYTVDGATNTVINTRTFSDLNAAPAGSVEVNAKTNRIYIGHITASVSEIIVVDGATNTIVGTLPVPNLYYFSVNPLTNRIYATSQTDGLKVFNGVDNSLVTNIPVQATSVAVNPTSNHIYVNNNQDPYNSPDTKVTIIDGATNTILGAVDVGKPIQSLDVNPVTNRIYASNYDLATNSAILTVLQEGAGTPPPPSTYSISGQVTDMTNKPLPGVKIFIGLSPRATTDPDGKYTITNLAPGTYLFSPFLLNYTFTPPARKVVVSENVPQQNFRATGYISGQIVDAKGLPVRYAIVTADKQHTAITDPFGNYTLRDLLPGKYKIKASLFGNTFKPDTINVTLKLQSTGNNFVAKPILETVILRNTVDYISNRLGTSTSAYLVFNKSTTFAEVKSISFTIVGNDYDCLAAGSVEAKIFSAGKQVWASSTGNAVTMIPIYPGNTSSVEIKAPSVKVIKGDSYLDC